MGLTAGTLPVRINLLPFRDIRKKENIRNKILLFFVFIALVIGGLIWYNGVLAEKISGLKKNIEKTNADIKKKEEIIRKVEELERRRDEFRAKVKAVKELEQEKEEAFLLLDALTGTVIEGRMWLTDFDIEEKITVIKETITVKDPKNPEKTKKKKVTRRVLEMLMEIKGIALDNTTVAAFMTKLENAKRLEDKKFFSHINLKKLEQFTFDQGKDKNSIDLKAFVVTCQKILHQDETDKAKKDKAKKDKAKKDKAKK